MLTKEKIYEKYLLQTNAGKLEINFDQTAYIAKNQQNILKEQDGMCLGFTYLFAKFLSHNRNNSLNLNNFIDYITNSDYLVFLQNVMQIQSKYVIAMNGILNKETEYEKNLKKELRDLSQYFNDKEQLKEKFNSSVENYISCLKSNNLNDNTLDIYMNELTNVPKSNISNRRLIISKIDNFKENLPKIYEKKISELSENTKNNIENYIPKDLDSKLTLIFKFHIAFDLCFLQNDFYNIVSSKKITMNKDSIEKNLSEQYLSLASRKYNLLFNTVSIVGFHSLCYAVTRNNILFFDSNFGVYSFPSTKFNKFSNFFHKFLSSKYPEHKNANIINSTYFLHTSMIS